MNTSVPNIAADLTKAVASLDNKTNSGFCDFQDYHWTRNLVASHVRHQIYRVWPDAERELTLPQVKLILASHGMSLKAIEVHSEFILDLIERES